MNKQDMMLRLSKDFNRKKCIGDVRKTSIAENHIHKYCKGKKYTSIDNNHKHIVDLKRGIALPAGKNNHIHKLF